MNFVKRFTFLFLSLVMLFIQQVHSQAPRLKSYKLFVNLENAPFDSLCLHDYAEGRDVLIFGKKIKKFTWEITIPDSIVWDSEGIELLALPNKANNKSSETVRFITKRAGKKIIIVNVGVEDKNNEIYGTYLGKTIFSDQKISVKVGSKDSTVIGNVICEDFNLIIKDANSDIAVRAQDPFFSWFMDSNDSGMTYNNYLTSYIRLSKKYPDSRYLISNLATNLTSYKSKVDVNKVYENISDKYKSTVWTKNIEQFLTDKKFPNTSLPNFYENKYENIIQDSSKYNLIIFSASWCKPCIEEVPLLKKIYNDLGKSLILTYVSIDNAQGVGSFKKLIKEQGIPWRTLFAYHDVKKIRQMYFIETVPHNILIYPNQDVELIDIRREGDRLKLYSAVKSLEN